MDDHSRYIVSYALAHTNQALDAGDGGTGAGHRGVRDAAGGPDRPGAPVHGVARRRSLSRSCGGKGIRHVQETGGPAPADARQGGALPGRRSGRNSLQVGRCLRGLRRLRATPWSLRGRVQLPAAAPGSRGYAPADRFLPVSAAGPRAAIEKSTSENAQLLAARAACAKAVLPGRSSGRPGPDDPRRPAAASAECEYGQRTAADDPSAEGGRR